MYRVICRNSSAMFHNPLSVSNKDDNFFRQISLCINEHWQWTSYDELQWWKQAVLLFCENGHETKNKNKTLSLKHFYCKLIKTNTYTWRIAKIFNGLKTNLYSLLFLVNRSKTLEVVCTCISFNLFTITNVFQMNTFKQHRVTTAEYV
jgi:hypothetical protein